MEDDSRMARLVKKHCGDDVWLKFSKHITEAFARVQECIDKEQKERSDKWKAKVAARRKVREAEQLKLRIEETSKIREQIEMVAGCLRSDFAEVFKWSERYGLREGDWLDDPVAAYAMGHGFGEEVKERSGVKLQVTVSIDLSNSMYYNNVHESSLEAFRTIYMMLEDMQKEHPGDLFIAAFSYSKGDDGRGATRVQNRTWYGDERELKDEYDLGAMERWRKGSGHYGGSGVSFSGEDTWMYPLFQEIEKWENEESDSGAVRLDIVITDAVLEHPKDIRESSVIQERRNGALQTVLLNLMPEEEWINSTLPLRCVQYPANRDNLGGLLRNILAEFVSVYM